jgi:hypothetical protein
VINVGDIELARLALQRRLDRARSQRDRNRFGQFATPGPLAAEILRYARRHLGTKPVRFLDPAIGTGAFYSALLRIFSHSRIAAATGFEIDPEYGNAGAALWRGSPLRLRLEDFTAAAPPPEEAGRYDLVICNPPYVRHHHLASADKRRLRNQCVSLLRTQLSGRAGLYVHFLILAKLWMADKALAGWLIPCEFMDVNYGDVVKEYLLRHVSLLRIHRFEPTDVQFDDATVSSAVVWFRNTVPNARHRVELTLGGSLSRPKIHRTVSASQLGDARKWTALFAPSGVVTVSNTPVLGDFFHIKRGIATGANDFFIMTAEQAEARGIPPFCLRPVLPGPRYLDGDEVLADGCGQPLPRQALFVLDCQLSDEQIRDRHPMLWQYLQTGAGQISRRYLCSRRSPWYSQERRESTYFLCSYIARARSDGRLHRFIFNQTAAIATNNYLMLYPRAPLAQFIGRSAARARLVWSELGKIDVDALRVGGRVYGGGVHKLEPSELAGVPAAGVGALLA